MSAGNSDLSEIQELQFSKSLKQRALEFMIEEDEIIKDLRKRRNNIYWNRQQMILNSEEKRVMELIDRQIELRKDQITVGSFSKV